MARLLLLIVSAAFVWNGTPTAAQTVSAPAPTHETVALVTQVSGGHAWASLQETSTSMTGDTRSRFISTHRRSGGVSSCGTWSDWVLIRASVTGTRLYGIYIFDGCNNDTQLFPPGLVACNTIDHTLLQAPYSTCATIPAGTLVVGLTPQTCQAQAVVATQMDAAVAPTSYDPSQPTPLSLTTTFGPDFVDRLSEGFCTDILDWQVLGWTIRWPDGTQDNLPGTGHQGVTATHTLAPAPAQEDAQQVVVIAHLHIHGQALDFDNKAQIVPVTRDAFVDISNDAAAVSVAGTVVYMPPQLQVAAIAVSQLGDGTLPIPDFAAPPVAHAVAIRGRLLELYPRAIVVQPASESADGTVIGEGVTTTLTWTYLGTITDAPLGEATLPGATGTSFTAVAVQYNHVETLDSNGNPVDEVVPLQITAHTVYPDGNTEDTSITQPVTVSIYYPALTSPA